MASRKDSDGAPKPAPKKKPARKRRAPAKRAKGRAPARAKKAPKPEAKGPAPPDLTHPERGPQDEAKPEDLERERLRAEARADKERPKKPPPPPEVPQVAGASLEDAEGAVLTAVVRLARQGSMPAANLATQTLQRLRGSEAARIHTVKMDPERPLEERAYYLGRIGVLKSEVVVVLEVDPEPAEDDGEGLALLELVVAAWRLGKRDRRLEIRAVELARALAGGDIPDWTRG